MQSIHILLEKKHKIFEHSEEYSMFKAFHLFIP